ncbi:MAG: hypothetical protein JWP97_3970 [Labilithrix sp.]|nr:hypothetical protein [Labilithrix sp.]
MLAPRTSHLALHAVRFAAPAAVLAVTSSLPVAALASVAVFMSAFTVAHDAAHGSLGLSRRAHAALLTWSALPMLISGHAMRRMHAIHHARPLAAEDLEGAGATRSALGALLAGPANAVALRRAAYRRAPRAERLVQGLESVAGAVLTAALVVSGRPALVTYAVTAAVMQLTMAFWASHVPHHAPAWAIAVSRRLAFLGSPVLLSLAYHELHHQNPRIPCQALASVR